MASLDQILDRMSERHAERLTLRAGEIPAVRMEGRDVPVQKVPLSESQVVALAREMAAGADAERLDDRQSHVFRYRGFEVRVDFSQGSAAVDVLPAPLPGSIPPLEAPRYGADERQESRGYPGTLGFDADADDGAASNIELDTISDSARPAAGTSGSFSPAPLPDALAGAEPAPVGAAVRAASPSPSGIASPMSLSEARPPGSVLDDMKSLGGSTRARYVAIGAAGALLLAVVGGALWCNRPVQVPNVVMADPSGHPVTFDDMRDEHRNLLIVFLLPNCQVSRFALDALKAAHPAMSDSTAFVGLFFGDAKAAEQYRKTAEVPFPVYGLKDNKDPFAVQELMKKVGTSSWMVTGVYGGTTILLDDKNRVVFKVEQEDVKKLPEKLASLDE